MEVIIKIACRKSKQIFFEKLRDEREWEFQNYYNLTGAKDELQSGATP